MSKLSSLGKYSAAITFLALEFFALMAFNYSGSFVVYGALSLGLVVLLILFNIKEIKAKGLSSVALFYIPLFLFTLLTCLGTYSVAHAKVGDFSYGELVFIPLGLLAMAFSGYLLSLDKHFKIKTFLTVIFSALAIYCLINLFYNIISFGAFYPLVYKNYYLYYNGIKSELPVNDFAYTLEGFKFIEVEMSHYVLYPLLLLSSSAMLLYLSPRKEKVMFILYSAFTLLAIICLVFVPSILSLLSIVVVAILDLVIFLAKRFIKVRKVFKVLLYLFIILFILFYLVYVLNNQSFASGISNLLAKNGLLNRIFNENKLARLYNPILLDLFSGNKFLGFATNELGVGIYEEVHLSGGFIFDSYMTSGVIGALALFLFIFLGLKSFKKYFKLHSDEFPLQATLFLFVIVFIGYSAFFNKGEYALYYRVYKPIYLTAPFMLMVFILSYVICKSHPVVENKEGEPAHE